jgi:hypothetical protein
MTVTSDYVPEIFKCLKYGDGAGQNQSTRGAGAQQLVDVIGPETEQEAVERAEHYKRDRRRADREERRDRVRGPKDAVHCPGLPSTAAVNHPVSIATKGNGKLTNVSRSNKRFPSRRPLTFK